MRRTSHRPEPPGKRHFFDARRRALEATAEAECAGRTAEQQLGALCEQPFAGAVHQTQPLRAVEREHGDVDLDHHRLEQRARLERAEALVVQRRGEDVDFHHHGAEWIVAWRTPRVAARARMEKSLSRSAASRFDSVCSGSTTRLRTLNEQPAQTPTMKTVSVHWTFGV